MLPPQLKHRASRLAKRLGISLGELIRDSLREALERAPGGGEDPLYADQVVFSGTTPADLAADHDDYLYGDES